MARIISPGGSASGFGGPAGAAACGRGTAPGATASPSWASAARPGAGQRAPGDVGGRRPHRGGPARARRGVGQELAPDRRRLLALALLLGREAEEVARHDV